MGNKLKRLAEELVEKEKNRRRKTGAQQMAKGRAGGNDKF